MNYRSILIATAQTLALFMAGLINPLGQFVALFTPVPLILVSIRNGRQEGFSALLGASLVIALLGGWHTAAVLVLVFGLMAIGIAEGMHRRWRHEQTVLLGGLLPVAVLGSIVLLLILKAGKNPVAEIDAYLRESISAAEQTYTRLGMTDMAAMVRSIPESIIYYFARLFPGIIIAISIGQAVACYGIARPLIARRPEKAVLPPHQPLADWYAPDSWVWGLIASLLCLVLPNKTAHLVGWNLALLFGLLYLAQGAAIVDYYLRKAQIKSFFRGLFHAVILALPSIVFVIALGVVDIWADVRKVRETAPSA